MAPEGVDLEHRQAGLSGLPRALRGEVRLLGDLLGRVIADHRGSAFVDRIETIRALAKFARQGAAADWQALSDYLSSLSEATLVDIARAFNQFLNLANIADQGQAARTAVRPGNLQLEQLALIRVELVLTAHPTEVLRRTLIRKYDAIAGLLNERGRCAEPERSALDDQLERFIAEAWHSDEIRRERPTPQDEARWGFAVVENSLWDAVPAAMRDLDRAAGRQIPLHIMPFAFSSWMGGDRDGNPSVTAAVTRDVLRLARWAATDLYLRDVNVLIDGLSMTVASEALRERAGDAAEPYRAVLKQFRARLEQTRQWLAEGGPPGPEVIQTDAELLEPLELCFHSLSANDMRSIATGPLLDALRRAKCFGVHLVGLDIRQHAARHTAVLDELTRYLAESERGFESWPESERVTWLLTQLTGRRPVMPAVWPASEDAAEVIETCAAVAENEAAGISAYVVSMANTPSDVLAVALLLKEAGLRRQLPIVPLFETLAALDAAADTVDELLSMPWYREYVGGHIQVMIGYSDSAKDVGQFAAAWAQYRAQEALVEIAARHGVELTLFHGRGGAIGRGGGPSAQAIGAQPPGSVAGSLRVTEQGEMIRFRLGTPAIAKVTLSRYLTAALQATFDPPMEPTAAMRAHMDELAAAAHDAYRATLRDPRFLDFFRAFTAEAELSALALGSRPARRAPARDIESLRAIPWVFAWTQVRLMLPAWLGTERALSALTQSPGDIDALRSWPFFAMQMDMLESVIAKADPMLVRYYSRRLANVEQQAMADALIDRLNHLRKSLSTLTGGGELPARSPALRDSMAVRNTYLDPLHLLQAELLARRRGGSISAAVNQALKVTMAGIASGLRSAG